MLVLNNQDISKIVSYEELLGAVRTAYDIYESNAYYMPDRFHVDYESKNILYMPCFLEHSFGTKILTIFPDNINRGLPALEGMMLLNDHETGAPTCIMDGKTVTALRTGAVGGLAVQYTTPASVKTVGLIGAGAQGYYQLVYATKVRSVEKVFIYDAFYPDLSSFATRLRNEIPAHVEIILCEESEALVRASDVVITATTATASVMPNNTELLRGKHFIGIGSYKPHMREFPDALYSLLDHVYIDTDIALEESGDLIQPIKAGLLQAEQLRRFSRLIRQPEECKQVAQGTSLFKSVGMSIFDIVTANLLYQKAQELGIGYSM